jgi:thymidylate kinase
MFPKIIVITGVDGSGKTTQAQLLVNYFGQKGISVGFAQQFDSETVFGKLILKKAGHSLIKLERSVSDESYFNSDNLKGGSSPKTLLKILAKIRIILTGLYHTWVKIFKNRKMAILIFDRYFYDDLNKAKWMYNISKRIEKLAIKFVPKPAFVFYLDVPVEIAWNREIDSSTTLEQHIKKNEIYDEWFSNMCENHKNFYKICTDKEVWQNHVEIINILKNEIEAI